MRILVTGGLGFIGHNVVSKLETLGHDVTILDNCSDYGVIPKGELSFLIAERQSKIITKLKYKQDIKTIDIFDINDDLDIVIHLASYPRQKVVAAHPTASADTMITGLMNLCEISAKRKIKKFVYISSSMVYGDFINNTTEDVVCNPKGQYGIMKLAGELLVKDYSSRGCFDYAIIRPSAVYGPSDVSDRVIARFMLSAMQGKTLEVNGANEELDFTYVDDTVNGIVGAALSHNTNSKTYNVTRGRSRNLLEAAEIAIDIVGKGNIKINSKSLDFPSRSALNSDAARRDFDFNPTIDLEAGLARYYDYLRHSTFWSSKAV